MNEVLSCVCWAGVLQMRHEKYSEAEGTFLAMMKLPGCKHDAYIWQALGVINLHKAHALLESSKVSRPGLRACDCWQTHNFFPWAIGMALLLCCAAPFSSPASD